MIIYKITNQLNQKCYIGQTIRTLEERWKRHQNDALNNVLNTHFARAIRYYGPENFSLEIIDTATTQEELTKKESYWIKYYNSIENGYNETDAENKSGGNTYKSKTLEEMEEIKEKIRQSKLGGKNPNASGVKCKNIETNEEYHFESQSEMQKFFNESNHQFISRRCKHEIRLLYQNKWLIAYENDPYTEDYTTKMTRRGNKIKVTDKITGEIKIFNSLREAEREMPQLPSRNVMSKIIKGSSPQPNNYQIENID